MIFQVKWGICEEKTRDVRFNGGFAKTRDFRLNGGFAYRKRVIFVLNGGFEKMRTRDFRLNGGFAKRKRVIFT